MLTPAGLREAPDAPRILPEWLGAYLTALVRVNGRDDAVLARAHRLLAEFGAVLDLHGAGVPPDAFEIDTDGALDAAPLQVAGEPVSLAGSAEIVRFWVEELDHAPAGTPVRI